MPGKFILQTICYIFARFRNRREVLLNKNGDVLQMYYQDKLMTCILNRIFSITFNEQGKRIVNKHWSHIDSISVVDGNKMHHPIGYDLAHIKTTLRNRSDKMIKCWYIYTCKKWIKSIDGNVFLSKDEKLCRTI